MFGRTFIRVLAVVALVAVVISLGAAVYNAGIQQGVAQVAQTASASGNPAPVVIGQPYYYGWGWGHGWGFGGFGFFGIIFWILGVFLIIGLLRAASGGRGRGPGGGWRGRYDRLEEVHRQLHERQDRQPS
jgi:hypothetical protein